MDDDEIVDFMSPMGNNTVPYPYATGKKNIYLTVSQKYFKDGDDSYHSCYEKYAKIFDTEKTHSLEKNR